MLEKIIVEARRHGFKPTNHLIHVSIAGQRMEVFQGGNRIAAYTVSTSKNPPSCLADSNGTPDGLHRIADKIGDDAPLGAVFKSRVPTGDFYWDLDRENLVTTRILWLEGLQPEHNRGGDRDSRDRYIYIHGTNHEDRLGQPQSGGCINMSNTDVIELYNTVEPGALVWIDRD